MILCVVRRGVLLRGNCPIHFTTLISNNFNPHSNMKMHLERSKPMFSKPTKTPPILASLLLAVIGLHQAASAGELPVNLGAAANFGVLAGSTVTSSGATIVNGDLGLWPGTAVSGFPPGIVNGTMHVNDPIAQAAEGDLTIAFNDAAGRSTAPVSITGDIGGMTLAP